jgi:hypothetical protein
MKMAVRSSNKIKTDYNAQFKTTLEVALIYIVIFITFLTFFSELNIFLYTGLGFLALIMFLSVVILMMSYVLYNFYASFVRLN